MDAIRNQNKGLATLTNKDAHKVNYQKMYDELVKERLDETKELTNKVNQNDLMSYVKANIARKRFDGFNNGIELKKMKPSEMKLEEAKN